MDQHQAKQVDRQVQRKACGYIDRVVGGDRDHRRLGLTEDAGRPDFWAGGKPGPQNNTSGGGNFGVIDGRVRGAAWADPTNGIPLHGFAHYGLSAPGPCPVNCTNNNEAYSFHRGGVVLQLADGANRFLAQQVEIEVYASMITARAYEVIDSPW